MKYLFICLLFIGCIFNEEDSTLDGCSQEVSYTECCVLDYNKPNVKICLSPDDIFRVGYDCRDVRDGRNKDSKNNSYIVYNKVKELRCQQNEN